MKGGNDRSKMDGETAMAFAGQEFERIHPKATCPDWLGRCTAIGYCKDEVGRFVVSFAITPRATNDAKCYFRVTVDPATAETRVLHDSDLSQFSGPDLQGY